MSIVYNWAATNNIYESKEKYWISSLFIKTFISKFIFFSVSSQVSKETSLLWTTEITSTNKIPFIQLNAMLNSIQFNPIYVYDRRKKILYRLKVHCKHWHWSVHFYGICNTFELKPESTHWSKVFKTICLH